jgi:DNA-binding response OmpR family regulator
MAGDWAQVVAHPDRGKPASVVIVEGEALIASFIDAVLGTSGFRVAGIAGSGPEALVCAARASPALALVDVRSNGL